MPSKLFRRSGVAVAGVCQRLDWIPDRIYQVGVGGHHEEIDVFIEHWPGVLVFGAEPNPRIYADIVDRYPGKLDQVAMSDFVGRTDLYQKPKHREGSSLYESIAGGGRVYNVPVSTLDEWWGPPNGQVLLWLDCEGSEYNILLGGEKFVEKVDIINVEMTASLPEGTGTVVRMHDWLKDHGFFAQWSHTKRPYNGQHDVAYVRRNLFMPEFCCFPEEIKRYGE